jgi:hypothetical protein
VSCSNRRHFSREYRQVLKIHRFGRTFAFGGSMRQRRRAAGIFSASQQRCISYSSFRCDGSSTGPFARPKPQSGASCGASEARFFFIARAVEQRCSCLSPSVRREGGSDAACCGDVAASNAMRARHQTFLEFGAPKPGVESLFRDPPTPLRKASVRTPFKPRDCPAANPQGRQACSNIGHNSPGGVPHLHPSRFWPGGQPRLPIV